VDLDGEANQANQSCISSTTSRVGVWVIPTDEEQVIAEDCLTMYQKALTH
jgi:acetate kinase